MDKSTLLSLVLTWPLTHTAPEQDDENGVEAATRLIREFEVERTAQTVVSYCRRPDNYIALQFPDSLLHAAPFVSNALTALTEHLAREGESSIIEETPDSVPPAFFFYILGDTSYGECCVDEVAAQHLDTHLIIHYGNACLSPMRTTPVLYVFGSYGIEDMSRTYEIVRNSLLQLSSQPEIERVVVLFDIELHSLFDHTGLRMDDSIMSFGDILRGSDVSFHVASLRLANPHAIHIPADFAEISSSSFVIGPLVFEKTDVPLVHTACVWFSSQLASEDWSPVVRNAAMALCTGADPCATFKVISLHSESASLPQPSSSLNTSATASRLLSKRFAQMSKVKDAERIGVVPGTLGVSGNVEIIERCKRVIENSGKRAYVMLVGKPNLTKLANFPDIDVFVLVACPQNNLLDARDYLQPIITPMELEAALLYDGDIFSGRYTIDFRELLEKELVWEDSTQSELGNGVVTTRGDWSVAVNGQGGGADYLRGRSWQGLKFDQGGAENGTDVADLPVHVQQGQHGRASRYDREMREGERNADVPD